MTLRLLIPTALILWAGCTLLLSERRWFARRPVEDRLAPYVAGGWQRSARGGLLSVETFREVIAPLAAAVGERVSRIFGIHEALATRLRRIHSPLDPTTVRVRQLTWAAGCFVVAGLVAGALAPPPFISMLLVLGGPLLAFLVIEQQIAAQSSRWQHRLFLELPVVSEQIGMLLTAGYSLGAAMQRVSDRGSGVCTQDLTRVSRRIRQGLSDAEALREWAELAEVPAVERLVGVLSLNRDTGDLGRLIAEEARSVRSEVQRQLAAQLDRREQQVWIPVTVATLVPGTIFLAVPFLQAMRLFAA